MCPWNISIFLCFSEIPIPSHTHSVAFISLGIKCSIIRQYYFGFIRNRSSGQHRLKSRTPFSHARAKITSDSVLSLRERVERSLKTHYEYALSEVMHIRTSDNVYCWTIMRIHCTIMRIRNGFLTTLKSDSHPENWNWDKFCPAPMRAT